jgi:transposase
MELLYPCCAGLDVHKDSVVACARVLVGEHVVREVETFVTTTTGLLALADWLVERGVTHVVMEATGVYWKPVWHVLEGSVELVLANAMHVKNVPGRKTDVNDATWLAELLAHGLIRGSFVPPTAIQELRALTRTRKQLVRERTQHTQRIQKTLEDANVKIASVISDVLGTSGRAILHALIEGEADPEKLAACVCTHLKASRSEIVEALRGRVGRHHRFLLKLHLDQIGALEQALTAIEAEVGPVLEPFRSNADLLTTIPGVSDIVAQAVVSEIGVDMARFPSAGHLLSWAGLCPRNDESAGKRRSTRLRKGAPWLKTVLVQAAWAATRRKDSYLRAQFLRLKSRRGPKKAIIAVAASMLNATYFMLRDGVAYQDLGAAHFERHDRSKTILRLVRKLHNLGCDVAVKEAA